MHIIMLEFCSGSFEKVMWEVNSNNSEFNERTKWENLISNCEFFIFCFFFQSKNYLTGKNVWKFSI